MKKKKKKKKTTTACAPLVDTQQLLPLRRDPRRIRELGVGLNTDASKLNNATALLSVLLARSTPTPPKDDDDDDDVVDLAKGVAARKEARKEKKKKNKEGKSNRFSRWRNSSPRGWREAMSTARKMRQDQGKRRRAKRTNR